MSGPVTIIARLRATEGKADALEALLRKQIKAVRAAEPGCLAYALHRSDTDPHRFMVIESYVDDDARKAHQTGAHLKPFREQRAAEGLMEGSIEVDVYRPVPE